MLQSAVDLYIVGLQADECLSPELKKGEAGLRKLLIEIYNRGKRGPPGQQLSKDARNAATAFWRNASVWAPCATPPPARNSGGSRKQVLMHWCACAGLDAQPGGTAA